MGACKCSVDNAYLSKRRNQARLKFLNRAKSFLKKINLPYQQIPSYAPVPEKTFFPNCWLSNGVLYFSPKASIAHVLHEAGHLALTPKSEWHLLTPGDLEVYPPLGFFRELGDAVVEAWDFAAAEAADIPSIRLFLDDGEFNGNGLSVWESFDRRIHFGFTLLRFLGMSKTWGKCDRWLVKDAVVSDSKEAVEDLMRQCTKIERKMLLQAAKAAASCQ